MSTKEHQADEGGIQLGNHVKHGSFCSSSMNRMSMDSIIEVLYYLQIMLIAMRDIVDNNFVFQ